jgi:hypothetical protein
MEISNWQVGDGNKKYKVIVNGKVIQFGDKSHQQFRDSTPLKLYSHLDHNDMQRRKAFHARHKKNTGIPAQLSKQFLW